MNIPKDFIEVQLVLVTKDRDGRGECLKAKSFVFNPTGHRLPSTITFRKEECEAVKIMWKPEATTGAAWETLYPVENRLPEVVNIDLSGSDVDGATLFPTLPRIHLLSDRQTPSPYGFGGKFEFGELAISVELSIVPMAISFLDYCKTHLRVLDLDWGLNLMADEVPLEARSDAEYLRLLFGACHVLEKISFPFGGYLGQILGSIPSSSVSLVSLHDPRGCYDHASEPQAAWDRRFLEQLIPEYNRLGTAIGELAHRFSKKHPYSKTRVRLNFKPNTCQVKEIAAGKIPFLMKKLEEGLGDRRDCVALELNPTELSG